MSYEIDKSNTSPVRESNKRNDHADDDEESNEPSRVVHFRSIPSEMTELDICKIGKPFGDLTNLVLVKKKNQALLEFKELSSAIDLVDYFKAKPDIRKGRQMYVQYSKHKELNTQAGGNFGAESALKAIRKNLKSVEEERILEESDDKKVLHVIVDKTNYPMNIHILQKVFQQYGDVSKVVVFHRDRFPNQFHAIVEMESVIDAQITKLKLDGQNIYNGCCTLKIDFSKTASLTIKYNNDKTWDFNKPNLPSGDGDYDDYEPSRKSPRRTMSSDRTDNSNRHNRNSGENLVIIVSNLSEEINTPESLFTLFGVYGDVQRVKVLYQKKDTALIQFSDGNGAEQAIQNLNGLKLWSKQMRINQSRHSFIQMPKESLPEAHLTKDFADSRLHRFKKPKSKNYKNIYPPSTTLHLSNIPEEFNEDYFRRLLYKHGKIVDFKFLPGNDNDRKQKKMALAQMEKIEDAVIALINLHDFTLCEAAHLRVSFSRPRSSFNVKETINAEDYD